MFLSTITDRFTYFNGDLSTVPLNDAQNVAAVYNAGIALRWMLANLDKFVACGTAAIPLHSAGGRLKEARNTAGPFKAF
jgi:hypothetical protein